MTEQQTIAVVGAGLMGHAIAHIMASAGHTVKVFDSSHSALASLSERLAAIAIDVGCNKKAATRITGHDLLADAATGVDFVIEAAPENLELKRDIVSQLEELIPIDAIIATNTSAMPITQIAARSRQPDRIVGAHFWNPPHLVDLVEVTQAEETSDDTISKTMALLAGAGQHPVHVKKDIPGFIGNRLQHALKREAIALVANGVCDAATIDDVVKRGFGQRLAVLGPLEQTDLVGLDLTKSIHDTLMPDLDSAQTCNPFIDQLLEQGHLGMKTGRGFYQWTDESAAAVRKRLNKHLAKNIHSKNP